MTEKIDFGHVLGCLHHLLFHLLPYECFVFSIELHSGTSLASAKKMVGCLSSLSNLKQEVCRLVVFFMGVSVLGTLPISVD